ncbi:MAG: FAD-dependent oxidoreductase [Lachnospiraceae bacterium]|nr:FAD-dependent oxidoreductase [Lachnospiraceae bacterium]
MIRIDQLKCKPTKDDKGLIKALTKKLGIREEDIRELGIIRKSIDARKKPELYSVYSVWIDTGNDEKILKRFRKDASVSVFAPVVYKSPEPGSSILKNRPVIVGMGPAGLFCAYELAIKGYKPLVIERGRCVEQRRNDVKRFWETGVLDTSSNVQFGEGGAGTFSDGKLSTSVKDKDGRIHEVLSIFSDNGAPFSILYEQMPHLGTDILPGIVKSIREKIIENGGEVRFETRLTGIAMNDGRVTSVTVTDREGATEEIPCEVLVLATGHSARDTYKMLYENGLKMEQKPFAAGFRVQHPQKMINLDRYGSYEAAELLGASPYKVTANFEDRGVFSFCMCPGGYVVNASSEEGELCVNGMSYSGRDSANANSAIVVSIPVSEYPSEHPLAGIEYQRNLEKRAYELAGGRIPAQRYGEFKDAVIKKENSTVSSGSSDDGCRGEGFEPVFKGEYEWCDLTGIFDDGINRLFVDGMTSFAHTIKNFDAPEVIMAGVESRTSSPVRIPRDENMESSISGIYPLGEGAGYAGGITSAAADGLRGAESIIRKYSPLD